MHVFFFESQTSPFQVADYTHKGVRHGHRHQQQQQQQQQQHPSLQKVSSNDFVIKEHTYSMCPGCPTFSIPVPIPKATLTGGSGAASSSSSSPGYAGSSSSNVQYGYARNMTFLERVGNSVISTMQGLQVRRRKECSRKLKRDSKLLDLTTRSKDI